MALYLIRYGELGLKSKRVRSRFESILKNNIMARFISGKRECRLESDRGRIYLWSDDSGFTEEVLSKTFGIVSYSMAMETDSVPESIYALAIEISKPLFKKGTSFAVRARRSGQHPYTSMELARDAGSAIYLANEELEPRVDLGSPELEVFIEVRQKRAFIYTCVCRGPGGMPLGSQGRVIGLLEEQRDIAACWLMMKRGCRVVVVAQNPELAVPLKSWDPELKVMPPSLNLDDIIESNRALGTVLGWDMERFDTESLKTEYPVFHSLIGMADADIEKLIKKIMS